MSEFLHMGGYALYVWGSYGVTALVLALELVLLSRQRFALRRELADAEPGAEEST